MSKIKNEPKIKNKLIAAIREQLEHRALWLYLLCDEAKKEGIDPTNLRRELFQDVGIFMGKILSKKAGPKV